ncbi:MAG: hypothetical protein ACRC9K_22340 [Afipia sp.]
MWSKVQNETRAELVRAGLLLMQSDICRHTIRRHGSRQIAGGETHAGCHADAVAGIGALEVNDPPLTISVGTPSIAAAMLLKSCFLSPGFMEAPLVALPGTLRGLFNQA